MSRRADILGRFDLDPTDLDQKLFDRLLAELPEGCKRSLLTQHRMVPAIGRLVSECFYKGKIRSPEKPLDPALERVLPKPVTWFATQKLANHGENFDGISFRNRCEATVVRMILNELNSAARNADKVYKWPSYGYAARAVGLTIASEEESWEDLDVECNTVDAFQGREADIAIYSVTRSNSEGKLGFLREEERLNSGLVAGLMRSSPSSATKSAAPWPRAEARFRAVLDHIEENPGYRAMKASGTTTADGLSLPRATEDIARRHAMRSGFLSGGSIRSVDSPTQRLLWRRSSSPESRCRRSQNSYSSPSTLA